MEDSEWQFIDYKFYIILKFDIYCEKNIVNYYQQKD